MPEVPMVATAGVPELQVPPDVASVSVMVVPLQTVPGPEIAATTGRAFTVIVFTAKPEQDPLV